VAGLNPQPDCIDLEQQLATPIVPNDGSIRVYADATSGNLAAIKSDGTSALPLTAPGGSTGDVQFNQDGVLANADTVASGSFANLDPSGNLEVDVTGNLRFTSNGSVFAVNGGGIAFLSSAPNNSLVVTSVIFLINATTPGSAIQVNADSQLALSSTNGPLNINSPTIGFFGATAIAQPAITGAKGGNTALASLITQLANLGLVTDSTT
jgi:hypothetical protein